MRRIVRIALLMASFVGCGPAPDARPVPITGARPGGTDGSGHDLPETQAPRKIATH